MNRYATPTAPMYGALRFYKKAKNICEKFHFSFEYFFKKNGGKENESERKQKV